MQSADPFTRSVDIDRCVSICGRKTLSENYFLRQPIMSVHLRTHGFALLEEKRRSVLLVCNHYSGLTELRIAPVLHGTEAIVPSESSKVDSLLEMIRMTLMFKGDGRILLIHAASRSGRRIRCRRVVEPYLRRIPWLNNKLT